jgi:5-methyltetrahydrofolate--homocysteine methyltransferase
MVIIGERINTSRKDIFEAVEKRDVRFIQEEAKKQIDAGASMLDINAGMMLEKEPECLEWLVKVIQDVVDVALSLDSSNPIAIERALNVHRGQALINSISLESNRYKQMIKLVIEHKSSVVGLCLDDKGFPKSSRERLDNASKLLDKLMEDGVDLSVIYLDPLICPLSTDYNAGKIILETINGIRESFAGAHTIVGISNISFGMPARRILNRAFLPMSIAAGVDAVIIDPLDKNILAILLASETLFGQDEFCLKFIEAFRRGEIIKS